MPSYDYDLGVIGGGAAGLTVTSGAAQLGAKVLLVEKEPQLGGDCLHYGCVPSKTLIHIAGVYHQMKTATRLGLPPVEPGPVDFSRVAARIQEVIGSIQHHDSRERFCGLGAEVIQGRARFRSSHQVEVDGRLVSARRWVLATGSSPALPPIPGLDRTPHLTNRELFSLPELPSSLIVIGAGPIAVEMAQAFTRLGCRVMVVQRSGQILSKEDPDLADLVRRALAREGVEFHLETKITGVEDRGHCRRLCYQDKQGRQVTLEAQAILVALGRRPNLEGLELEQAGVEYGPRGVTVDARLRSSRPHIFACGDVIGPPQFTHAAGYQAGVVLANAIFRLPRKVDYTWLPWCTYCQPELASLGLNEKAARQKNIAYRLWSAELAHNDRAQAEGAGPGRIKLLLDQEERPLGVQILAPRAGELLAEWVAVTNGKVKLSTLAGAMHPYPTLAELNKQVAGDLMAAKLFSQKIRRGLKFFFSLKGRACSLPEQEPGHRE